MRVGEVELLVEAVQVAGSEPTSRLDSARERTIDAFDRAREAIVAMGVSTVALARDLAAKAPAPEKIELEFGLKISVQGNVILAGGSGEATLTVRLTFPGHVAEQAPAIPPIEPGHMTGHG
ncbi:CU044_2847 family protein [Nonomuraea rubra]